MGVEYVTFEEYQGLGGRMDKSTFEGLRNFELTPVLYAESQEELKNQGFRAPGLADRLNVDIQTYARILALNPEQSPTWKVAETYRVQGIV